MGRGDALRGLALALAASALMGSDAAGAGLPVALPAPVGSSPVSQGLPAHTTLPVFRTEVPAGGGTVSALPGAVDPPHPLDGSLSTWTGSPTGWGGTTIYSHGELIYQDHVFDAYGAASQQVAQRTQTLDTADAALPEAYRVEGALNYMPNELGIPTPGQTLQMNYGVLGLQDQADLVELRTSADASNLWLLARTTTMTTASHPALLVLLSDGRGTARRSVPFNSGLSTSRADKALLITQSGAWIADLATGVTTALGAGAVASNPSGYDNVLEARLSLAQLGLGDRFQIAAATGLADPAHPGQLQSLGDGPNLANVAFRDSEPVRDYFDKQQALALYAGSIDSFFHDASLTAMREGVSQAYQPGPGYHDRVYWSDPGISQEADIHGVWQHYGVYLPSDYRPGRRYPVQWWFHFRGGNAHIAATVVPGLIWDLAEREHSILVSPDGRGESSWYVGKGMLDVQEVWGDVHRRFEVDRNREYISGHSMGGWATYLLSILHPDWFAAGLPVSPPVTQGAWTGLDAPGCDAYQYADYSPCFISANGGDPRGELTTPLLDNTRWVPLAIYQGGPDELVPVTGQLMQAKALQSLGYRYRLYLFPAEEHYGPPIVDQWGRGAEYMHSFVRDPNPPEVTYKRSMVFEHDVNTINTDGDTEALDFHFDHAYWMSDLQPVDAGRGLASVDASTLAIPARPHLNIPEADAGVRQDQGTPYTMNGQAWLDQPLASAPAARNAFTATLSGARTVRLSLPRMRLTAARPLSGTVTTDHALTLELAGPVGAGATATVDGAPVALTRPASGVVSVVVPAGTHTVALGP